MLVPNYIEKFHFITDIAFTSIKPQVDLVKGVIGIFRDNFNGLAGNAFMYKPSRIFKIFWKLASAFMPKKTLQKARFIQEGTERENADFFDLDDLQQQYGGNIPDITENFWPPKIKKDSVYMTTEYALKNNIKEFTIPVDWLKSSKELLQDQNNGVNQLPVNLYHETKYVTVDKKIGDPNYTGESQGEKLDKKSHDTKDTTDTSNFSTREANFAKGDANADPDKIDYSDQKMMKRVFEAKSKKIKEQTAEIDIFDKENESLKAEVEYLTRRLIASQTQSTLIINDQNEQIDSNTVIISEQSETPHMKYKKKMKQQREKFQESKFAQSLTQMSKRNITSKKAINNKKLRK